ncbi:MAG: formylglycine-generating enzyme family protein [Victivallaceae bacterium]|nr:formylglycine-generating enzyme family protein [Victivallaceae bacterium]
MNARRFSFAAAPMAALAMLLSGCHAPGDVTPWRLADNGMALEMVWCPSGSFKMGSPADEPGRYHDEEQRLVTLSKPFWIGKYEVTQAQYLAVTGENPSRAKGGNRPVESLRMGDAIRFCGKLNSMTEGTRPAGYEFALPTEAQWEYACRARSGAAYSGDIESMGWYAGNSEGRTHDVGQLRPNAWGIHDMHGNVWEMCRDIYGMPEPGAATDPKGPDSGCDYVRRGGAYSLSAGECRSAYRTPFDPGNFLVSTGFRVALVPVQ